MAGNSPAPLSAILRSSNRMLAREIRRGNGCRYVAIMRYVMSNSRYSTYAAALNRLLSLPDQLQKGSKMNEILRGRRGACAAACAWRRPSVASPGTPSAPTEGCPSSGRKSITRRGTLVHCHRFERALLDCTDHTHHRQTIYRQITKRTLRGKANDVIDNLHF